MKVLFQGDSITDAGRSRTDPHELGLGYPFYSAELIREAHPDLPFEFLNLGIGGNRTIDLVNRLQSDFIDVDPDVLSVMIGINDTWHFYGAGIECTDEQFERNLDQVFGAVKSKTHAKLIVIEPYLLPVPDKMHYRERFDPQIQLVRAAARKYADVFVPLDGLFAAACIDHEPTYWSADGVHPNENGARFIAHYYAKAFDQLLGK